MKTKNRFTIYIILLIFLLGSNLIFAQARLQVIHNAADIAADPVDVYLNGDLLLEDFAFRSATPFIDAPAGVELNVGIALPNTSVDDTLKNFKVTLEDGETYVAIANGLTAPGDYAANPDGRNTAFDLFIKPMAREAAENNSLVEFFAFHGATDAPTVDVVARDVATLVDDAAYGDMTDYLSVPASNYILDVTPGHDNGTIVASFEADLSGLTGGSAVVLASGFLTPDQNQNGESFGLIAVLADGTVVEFPMYEPTARLQVIHNSADVAADPVDVYLNGDLLLEDFAFRSATPFIDAPAGVELNIGVALPNTSIDDTLKNFKVTLEDGETYVAIANGVTAPDNYASNPDGRNTGFDLFIKPMAREAAEDTSMVEFFAVHGSTDAPTVDVIARDVATLVDDAAYGDITDYLAVPASDYILEVTPGNDNNTVVAAFDADLSGLTGGSAVVLASGFLTPDQNQNGESFGLIAVLADGTVVEFPMYEPTARLQVIHNSADVAADPVDVYLNGDLLLEDFAFRSATPFIDAPAGVELNIGVALPNTSVDDTLKNFKVTLEDGETYIAIANGVTAPDNYASNPDGRNTAFNLWIKTMAKESADEATNIDFFGVHGATDAPTVDLVARNVGTLVNDAAYGDITDYLTVPAGRYILDVTPGNDNSVVVASFDVDLRTLGGASAAVLASGFLAPDQNQNGESFGLIAVLADGTVVEFPMYEPTARLQVIHNSADVAADPVDVYLNGDLLLEDFAFRSATPFIDAPARTELNIGIALPNTSIDDTLKNFKVTLDEGETYVAIANGVTAPDNYASNPDGRNTTFDLWVKQMAREIAEDSLAVEFFAVHGATDAPTVDVIARDVATLVDDAAYGDITDYLAVPAGSYILDVTPGSDNSTIVASFEADLTSLAGGSAVILASGFLTPAQNQNGEAFTLLAVLADGTVLNLDGITSVANEFNTTIPNEYNLSQNYPNPFNPTTKINFSLPSNAFVSLKIYDILGKEIVNLVNQNMEAGVYTIDFNAADLTSGIYFYRLQADNFVEVRKMNLIK